MLRSLHVKLIAILIAFTFIGTLNYSYLYALSFPMSNVIFPSQVDFEKSFEHIHVTVYYSGDVYFSIMFNGVELSPILPRVPGATYSTTLTYTVGSSELTFYSNFVIKGIVDERDIDAYIYNITKSLEYHMGIQFKNMVKSWISPTQVTYTCTISNLNPDEIVDAFFKLKPNEGFMSIVTKNFLRLGDKISLQITDTSNFAMLTVSRFVKNYFNFKPGNTYILDIFKLLNLTNPITTHPKSNYGSGVSIHLLYYTDPETGGLQRCTYEAEIVEIKLPFEYGILKSRIANLNLMEYTIEGRKALYTNEGLPYVVRPLTAGDVVEYMQIKFNIVDKIAESSFNIFKIDLTPTTIIGIILIVASCASIPIIIRRTRKRSPNKARFTPPSFHDYSQ
jgi:hypothetical protein